VNTLTALVLTAVLGLPAVMRYPGPAETLKAADEAMKKITNLAYEVHLVTATDEPGEARTLEGEVMLKRLAAQEGDEAALGWKMYFGEHSKGEEHERVHIACDGFALRSVNKKEETIFEKNIKDVGSVREFLVHQGAQGLFPIAAIDPKGYGQGAKLESQGKSVIDGIECEILFIDQGTTGRRVHLAMSDHLPRRIEELERPAQGTNAVPYVFTVRSVATISKVRTGAVIADNTFLMDVPDGYTVRFATTAVAKKEPEKQDAAAAQARQAQGGTAPIPRSTEDGSLVKGAQAPAWSLIDADGKQVNLKDFAGKVVVMDFWGSWCPPCRAAMPSIQRIHEKFKDQDVVVIGLNWERDAKADPKKFMADNGYTYKLVLGADQIASEYRVRGWPTFYIIDRAGDIVWSGVGFMPARAAEHEAQMTEAIEAALNAEL
jgi:thiol-disulfide isomerase/thioredoxin